MKSHLSAFAALAFACIFFLSCKHEELINPDTQNKDKDKAAPNYSLDATKMGQWEVVSKGYNISVDDIVLNSLHAGQVYYPKGAITQGPLVLFLHGNGTGGYNNYSEILSQLASQGFSVASIGWPSGDYKALEKVESIKTHIFKHIRYLYNDNLSPLKGKITDNIILVGHSRGGAAAVGFAADIDKIKNVQSVIALAPSPAELDMPEKFSLACTSSFLVIYGSGDADVTGKVCDDGYIRKSGFKFFDDAGDNWGNISFTKDMIFIEGLNHIGFCDKNMGVQQQQIIDMPRQHIIKGYINAFLQLHINKKEGYNTFFKYQTKIPSMSPSIKISQQHVDGEKLVLTNFENDNADKFTHYAGNITYPASTINIAVNKAPLIDATSFHATKVMAIAWQQNNSKPAPVIDFAFKNKVDLSLYNHVSIRAGISPFYLNQQDKPQSFYVQLLDDNGAKSSLVPVTIPASFFTTASKSYMQSFLLPLGQFKGIDIKKIKSVSLLFTNKNYYQGKITIDNIEFYK